MPIAIEYNEYGNCIMIINNIIQSSVRKMVTKVFSPQDNQLKIERKYMKSCQSCTKTETKNY